MKITWAQLHSFFYILGLCLLAASLPLSRFGMSVAEIMLFCNWLIEGGLVAKFRRFIHNRAALVLSSLFLLHIIGLFFTSDFNYALKDLRIKVPLALLPLVFSSMPELSFKKVNVVFGIHILAVLLSSILSTWYLVHGFYIDIRAISPFVSHIRLSLNVCTAIVILVWFYRYPPIDNKHFKITALLTALWFVVFLYFLESLTGIFILLVLLVIFLIRGFLITNNKGFRWSVLVFAIIIPLFATFLVFSIVRKSIWPEKVDFSKLEKFSPRMNPYEHDSLCSFVINGHYLWIYVCKTELEEEWNKVSDIPFTGQAHNGQNLSDVLIRYMTSLGLRKDMDGFKKLNPDDFRRIENGETNALDHKSPRIVRRMRAILWEYQNYISTGDPSGHSITMRIEYWKASLGIIKQYPMGVGTGDMNRAFEDQYNKMNSELKPEWRRRSHNQFLSITVGFGIIGLIWFVFTLIYPPLITRKFSDFRFAFFFLVLLLSMLTEDTIESQDGVTYMAFFFNFLLFVSPGKNGIFVGKQQQNHNE